MLSTLLSFHIFGHFMFPSDGLLEQTNTDHKLGKCSEYVQIFLNRKIRQCDVKIDKNKL